MLASQEGQKEPTAAKKTFTKQGPFKLGTEILLQPMGSRQATCKVQYVQCHVLPLLDNTQLLMCMFIYLAYLIHYNA